MPTPKWIRGTPSSPAAREHPGGVRHHGAPRSRPASARPPRSRTAVRRTRRPRPAPRGRPRRSPAILRISASQTSGAPNIIALVFACSLDGPPSTRYDATVNGAPGEPDQRGAAQLGHQAATASVMNGDVLGRQVGDRLDVGERAHRRGDDRADAGLDVEVDPDRLERQHDVGEEDGRVDAVPAHRLQRDLDDQLGFMHDSSIPTPSRTCEVLRQRAARLAHEPDRGVRHRLAARPPSGTRCRSVGRRHAASLPGEPRGRRRVRTSVHGPADLLWAHGRSVRRRTRDTARASELRPSSGTRSRPCERHAAPGDLLRGDAGAAADRAVRRRAVRRRDRRRHDVGTGRIILLHDPAGNDAWEGTFRCVAYAAPRSSPRWSPTRCWPPSAGPG